MLISKPSPQQVVAGRAFVDIDSFSVAGLASVPSPSISPSPSITSPSTKTHAFFSTSFTTRPPSPKPAPRSQLPADFAAPAAPQAVKPPRSRTADFFSAKPSFGSLSNGSSQSSAPSAASFQASVKPQTTSPSPTPAKGRRSFLSLDILPSFTRTADNSHDNTRIEYSESPVTTTILTPTTAHRADQRAPFLDTPKPPPAPAPPSLSNSYPFHQSDAPIETQSEDMGSREDAEVLLSAPPAESHSKEGSEGSDELSAGMVIRSVLSVSGSEHQRGSSPSPTSDQSPVVLRLTQPLGVGAFSSVWLAQDISATPLLVKSRRSLRDIRRRAASSSSIHSSDPDQQDNIGRLKSSRSSSSLMRRLRGTVSGTRPTAGALSPEDGARDNLSVSGHAWSGSTPSSPQRVRHVSMGSMHHEPKEDGGMMPSFSASLTDSGSLSVVQPGAGLSRASSVSWKSSKSSDGESEHVIRDEAYIREMQNRYEERRNKRRLVAVKLTSRGIIESDQSRGMTAQEVRERDRTRVGFVREVEILRHISHPNITPLLSHLTTKSHHVLVLPYYPGGDLLGLVNGDVWQALDEDTLRRIFSELCKAVAWMHGVGLVHRDIKLENILLTVPLLASSCLSDSLPPTSTPLIKLTDFGLSRFIDPAEPLLSTRCGSEAYAAPELVISGGRMGVASSSVIWGDPAATGTKGYDARETDAWACGIVLYGLVARHLPFGEGPGQAMSETGIRGEGARGGQQRVTPSERRQWLMKIARGEWTWPEDPSSVLCSSVGARMMAERLLVRDPSRRSRVVDLLSDEWMDVSRDLVDMDISHEVLITPPDQPGSPGIREEHIFLRDDFPIQDDSLTLEEDDEDEDEDDAVDPAGFLVDSDSIHSIARSEVQ